MEFLGQLVRREFTFRVFEAYPKQLGAVKYNCVMLLDLLPDGRWTRFSAPGLLIDEQIGLLIERNGRQVFVHKAQEVPAEGAPLENYRRFVQELEELLAGQTLITP
ncbi:MAG: hypothetical protein EXQ56_14325 [Acidobacteria bacterium]|nr:hypothetical protein [Acidobacteriota bacterium]